MPHVHRIRIHDPGHGLLVGVHVRRWNILLRPDEIDNLRRVAACHPLQLALAHLLGVADHSAFGPAKRNIDHRALPGHPTGQRPHFIQRYVRRVAYAALAGAAGNRVLHPEAGEHLDLAAIQSYGKMHDDLAGWSAQHLPQTLVQIQFACRKFKTRVLRLPGIDLLVQSNCCHTPLQFPIVCRPALRSGEQAQLQAIDSDRFAPFRLGNPHPLHIRALARRQGWACGSNRISPNPSESRPANRHSQANGYLPDNPSGIDFPIPVSGLHRNQ